MTKWLLRTLVVAVVLAIVAVGYLKSLGMFASDPVYTRGGLAINGYDPVAYFTQGQPRIGKPEFAENWNGARWVFSSETNRTLFRLDPERYAPQFGGYCAYAVSENYTARTDSAAWAIVDGKLYLNFDLDTQNKWQSSRDQRIAQAQLNWPQVLW